MDTVTERLIAWFLRSLARAMLSAGGAMLLAGVPLFALLRSESDLVRQIASTLLQLGIVFLVTGIAARSFLRAGARPLPNEEKTITVEQPVVGGWLQVMAFALIAAPIILVVSLQPFLAECLRAKAFLDASGIWNGASQNMAGIVLIPIFGAMTPPLLELATMAAFVGTSAILFPLLAARSHRFPRTYIVCLILVSGLALASVRGAYGVNEIAVGLRQLIDTTTANAREAEEIRQGLDRYTNAVSLPVLPLVMTWFAYAVWLPPLLSSPRGRETFAKPPVSHVSTPVTAQDVAAVTKPPRFPGMGF
jgi:hypothetical protein